jgi:hypothetical protein
MADSKTNPLTCKQCGYANEGERVYCHNCGTKLDRSLLPTSAIATEETLAKKQKRIRKAVTPRRGFFAGSGKFFVYTMLSAVVVAALILVVLPPDDVPAEIPKTDLMNMDVRAISMELENDIQSTAPVSVTLKQSEINPYLQYTIKAATTGYLADEVKFERVFVNLDEDLIRISAEETVFGLPVYSTAYYRLAIRNNKLEATLKGGNFGRLKIHPKLMQNIADSFFQTLWDALKRDHKSLDHCSLVEVHKDHIDLVTQPEVAQ